MKICTFCFLLKKLSTGWIAFKIYLECARFWKYLYFWIPSAILTQSAFKTKNSYFSSSHSLTKFAVLNAEIAALSTFPTCALLARRAVVNQTLLHFGNVSYSFTNGTKIPDKRVLKNLMIPTCLARLSSWTEIPENAFPCLCYCLWNLDFREVQTRILVKKRPLYH